MPDNEEMIELDEEQSVEVDLEATTEQPIVEESVLPAEEDITEEPSEEELANYSAGVRKRIDKLNAKYREA